MKKCLKTTIALILSLVLSFSLAFSAPKKAAVKKPAPIVKKQVVIKKTTANAKKLAEAKKQAAAKKQAEIKLAASKTRLFNVLNTSINSQNMLNTITELASSKYDGRLAGTDGNHLAEDYIASYFKKIGLVSPKGIQNYKQTYSQYTSFINSEPRFEVLDNEGKIIKKYTYLNDFNVKSYFPYKMAGDVTGSLVVINKIEDFTEENVKDKIVLVPLELNQAVINKVYMPGNIFTSARAILTETDFGKDQTSFLRAPYIDPQYIGMESFSPLSAIVSRDLYKDLVTAASNNNSVKLNFSFSTKEVKASNIIGMIPGTDKKLANNYMIICGHFDHVGDNKNGSYNPGSFDNASGTASVLEIARILKANKVVSKRPILFIAFNGEEEGLYGSRYFVSHPITPLKNSTVINLDMTGFKNNLPLTIDETGSSNKTLVNDLIKYGKQLNINCKEPSDNLGGGSDHESFQKAGVQAVIIVDDDMSVIHTPRDTPDKIDPKDMTSTLKLILYYMVQKIFF